MLRVSLRRRRSRLFEPLLGALTLRMAHVMARLCPVTENMLREGRERSKVASFPNLGLDTRGSAS
jgi:hypothetical protein